VYGQQVEWSTGLDGDGIASTVLMAVQLAHCI
jgi:hypothetical protein